MFGARVPVSSLKGHLGHTLAACGALETIASVRMMQESLLIPTRNLENVDPACAQIQHLQERRTAKVGRVLSNNFAFGGLNTCLILSRDHV
jgi:3-oxoacyl-[acyl-carrier-protein] synthase II